MRDPFFLTLGQKYLPPALGYLLAGGTLIAFVFFDVRHQSSLSRVLGEQVSYFKRFARYAGYLLVGAAFVVVMNSYEGIPIAVFVLLLLAGALTFVLAKTRFGRKVYAVGGNPRAARMSGINNAAVCMTTFIIMGGLAGMAGVLQTARLADVYKRQAEVFIVPVADQGGDLGDVVVQIPQQLLGFFQPYLQQVVAQVDAGLALEELAQIELRQEDRLREDLQAQMLGVVRPDILFDHLYGLALGVGVLGFIRRQQLGA